MDPFTARIEIKLMDKLRKDLVVVERSLQGCDVVMNSIMSWAIKDFTTNFIKSVCESSLQLKMAKLNLIAQIEYLNCQIQVRDKVVRGQGRIKDGRCSEPQGSDKEV